MTNVVTLPGAGGDEEILESLDALAGEGACRMIAAALCAEADEYVERYADEVDEHGIGSWFATAARGSGR
jgi:hypothetical protein